MADTDEKSDENSGLSEQDQKRYVTDVGDTGSLLQSATTQLVRLLPRMWRGQLRNLDTLQVVAKIREALVQGVSNVEILESYLREWIKAGKKGQELSLVDARTMILKAKAEDVVSAIKFDDEIRFTFTSPEFPEGEGNVEQWAQRTRAEFDSQLQGFLANVSSGD
jgi:hypothetical protein